MGGLNSVLLRMRRCGHPKFAHVFLLADVHVDSAGPFLWDSTRDSGKGTVTAPVFVER